MKLLCLLNFSCSGKMQTAEVGRSPQLQDTGELTEGEIEDGETAASARLRKAARSQLAAARTCEAEFDLCIVNGEQKERCGPCVCIFGWEKRSVVM